MIFRMITVKCYFRLSALLLVLLLVHSNQFVESKAGQDLADSSVPTTQKPSSGSAPNNVTTTGKPPATSQRRAANKPAPNKPTASNRVAPEGVPIPVDKGPDWMGNIFLPAFSPEIGIPFNRVIGIGTKLSKVHLILADDTARRFRNWQGGKEKYCSLDFPSPGKMNSVNGPQNAPWTRTLSQLNGQYNALGTTLFGLYRREDIVASDKDHIHHEADISAPLDTRSGAHSDDCWLYSYQMENSPENRKAQGKTNRQDTVGTGKMQLFKQKVTILDCYGYKCTIKAGNSYICQGVAEQGSPVVCSGKLSYLLTYNEKKHCGLKATVHNVAEMLNDIKFNKS